MNGLWDAGNFEGADPSLVSQQIEYSSVASNQERGARKTNRPSITAALVDVELGWANGRIRTDC